MARAFFGLGIVFLLVGMGWGIVMSASGDHSLSPAHAHLNLVGFVLSAVFGSYYGLSPAAGATKLARAHLGLHALAVVIMIPGIVSAISGTGDIGAKIGSVLAIASVVVFGLQIMRHGIPAQAG